MLNLKRNAALHSSDKLPSYNLQTSIVYLMLSVGEKGQDIDWLIVADQEGNEGDVFPPAYSDVSPVKILL